MRKLSILVVALVLVASNVWAFGGGCGRGGGHGMNPDQGYGMDGMGPGCGMGPNFASSLSLTSEQQTQIQAKREAFQAQIIPLREKMIGKKMELRSLWATTDPDRAKITAKQKEIQSLQSQIQDKCTQYRLDTNKLLTPEQKQKLVTMTGRCGGWGGHGGGRMGCW